jgi:large conductance mechanosensitive channel
MLKEFKEFVMRGNVVDMAVGIIIGVAFGAIVKSLVVSNLFIVLKHGATAGPYASLADAKKAGAVTINYGVFINTIISFIIIAFAVFLLISSINRLKRQPEAAPAAPTAKECPYCLYSIPIKATRCPHCTSELKTL